MKASLVTSIGLHVALAIAGTIVAPSLLRDETPPPPPVTIPLEFKIAETVSMKASAKEEKPAAKDEDTTTKATPTDAAPAQSDNTETIPDSTSSPSPSPSPSKPPQKEPPKRSAATTAKDMQDEIAGMMKNLRNNKPAENPADKNQKANAPNLGRNTQGYGKEDQDSQTFAVYFSNQMKQRQCWADQDDLPDAPRLKASFRVAFGPDGRLKGGDPEMVEPSRYPAGDRPMTIFLARAIRALHQCEPFTLPEAYRKKDYPPVVLDFLP